ncbi:MAG: response regulator [Gammaproteobacteria bacterium]
MIAPQHEASVLDVTVLAELSDIASQLSTDSPDVISALQDYRHKVEHICAYINQDRYAYLLDFLMILLDGLDQLVERDRGINESERAFLQKATGILSEYLVSSGNTEADEHLLELLQDPHWIRPITAEEALQLSASTTLDNTEAGESIELDELLSGIEGPVADNSTAPEIIDFDTMDIEHLGEDVLETDNEHPQQDCDVIDLAETGIDEIVAAPVIDSAQQELVDLIRSELEEIIDKQYDPEYDFTVDDRQLSEDILKTMADRADNISNALELIGLEGLCRCGKFVAENILSLSNSIDALDKNRSLILKQWPAKILKCLQNINDARPVSELMSLLTHAAWPVQMDNADREQTSHLLAHPVFNEEERQQRQVQASEADVDLAFPDDVNQELLDGLLQDLPTQTEEFSTAIQNLAQGGGIENIDIAQRIAHTLKGAANVVGVPGIANLTHHLEDLLEAQAKARALPQSALMDVLVRAADCLESMAEALLGIDAPPDDAVNVLQAVLDWINREDTIAVPQATTQAPTPQTEVALDDLVLAPDISTGMAELDTQYSPDQEHVEPAGQKTPDQPNPALENVLRVPVTLADEMLRLAGENLIHTSQIKEGVQVIIRKQDALDLHNQSLLQLSYDLEHLIDIEGFTPRKENHHGADDFDALEMDEYHEIHTLSRRLVEIAADSMQLSQELDKDLAGLKELVVDQDKLHKESEELVLRTRMVPVKTIIPRLKRGVRQACRLTGKQVELSVQDNNTYMDSEVLNGLIEPVMHILRNAIDHGIEEAHDRIAQRKSAIGNIKIVFARKGNHVVIDIIDDGQGLNTDRILSKALDAGLLTADEEPTTEIIHKLILEPGFTTRREVTQVSGRGIGLDVVTVKIRDLKGSIAISSTPGEGCRFSLSLPISSFSTHSLLVRCRQYIYAISSHGVEEILYPGSGELKDVGDVTLFQLGQDVFSVVLLDDLLNLPPDRRKVVRGTRPILLVKDETGTISAVMVQSVLDSRDVVVKSMGKYMPKLDGIIGATVLGDGSVSSVIDLPEMLRSRDMLQQKGANTSASAPVQQMHKLPHVLVVDDSLSARRSLAQFVEDMGFTVRTARDGMEAVSIIDTSRPDLLLVDMEMPKMNGLELTAHIRATPGIKDLPVIMITSRSTDKHRKAAIDKGVSHYMIKPFDEDELALQINTLLEPVE